MLDLTSTTEEKVPVSIKPTTKAGNASTIDGKVSVTVTSGKASFEAATDAQVTEYETGGFPGLVGFVVSEDTAGTSAFSVSADADLGAGVVTIVDQINYVYNHPQAQNLGLSSGSPVSKV